MSRSSSESRLHARMLITSSILSRVPTDQQLTLHLLRVAEALNTPLPRPP